MKGCLLIVSMFFCFLLQAQGEERLQSREPIPMFGLDFSFAGQTPAGDMAERFGDNGSLAFGVQYKTAKNWVFGLQGAFLFGRAVKVPVALGLRNADGFIIDDLGNYTRDLVLERGMSITAYAGKVIPIFGSNQNSGLVLKFGSGFLEHRILIETRFNDVPQLEGDYIKGYDRLTNGLHLYQFIGYRNFSDNRLLNFSLGLEGLQGLTQSRRAFNFDDMARDTRRRLDGLVGVRLTWTFPLYEKASDDYYYY